MTVSLYERYLAAKQQHPGKYARDLAALLNVSEAELTYARVGHDARRLRDDTHALMEKLIGVGEIKAITRNEYAVHQHLGNYQNQKLQEHVGLVLNPRQLDLRLFLSNWQSAFTLSETTRHGESHSIQIFDKQGNAVHKIYATEQTDQQSWDQLIADFVTEQNAELSPPEAKTTATAAPTVSAEQVDQEWRAMTNVHQFFELLRRHNLTRQQAFNLVGKDLAYRVSNKSLALILDAAKEQQNEIMVFVTNSGCTQIFTGHLEKIAADNGWINIFNERFTLHLVESAIADSWISRKPTKDGFVTSLELFAADGTQIAQFYGQRTEGQPEQTIWRQQIEALPRAEEMAA